MTIRTTTLATNNTMLNYLMENQASYNKLSEQASTQVKLTKPSDNSYDAVCVLDANKELSQLEGYDKNITLANNEIAVSDDALSSMISTIQDIYDLTMQAANGTNANNLSDIKTQIDQLIQSVVTSGNTQYNGAYIFSGTATGTEPFSYDSATGLVTYNGNSGNRTTQIADGVSVNVNVAGASLLGDSTGGIFKTLTDLSAALGSGDTAVIQQSVGLLNDSVEHVTNAQTKLASTSNRMDLTAESIQTSATQLTAYKKGLENIDLTEVATLLAASEVALNATMSVVAKNLQQTTLLNYL